MSDSQPRVLFVCLGNICRSPAAEGVLQQQVADAGLDWRVDSAGTGDWHIGQLADQRMRSAAKRRGYDLQSRARQVQPDDFLEFDWIVAMDRSNYGNLEKLRPADGSARLVMFCDYAENRDEDEVPDPYYGGPEGFDLVIDILEDGCQGLIAELRS